MFGIIFQRFIWVKMAERKVKLHDRFRQPKNMPPPPNKQQAQGKKDGCAGPFHPSIFSGEAKFSLFVQAMSLAPHFVKAFLIWSKARTGTWSFAV